MGQFFFLNEILSKEPKLTILGKKKKNEKKKTIKKAQKTLILVETLNSLG
jgi:hypothetical protein